MAGGGMRGCRQCGVGRRRAGGVHSSSTYGCGQFFLPRDAHVILLAPSGEPHDVYYMVLEGPGKGFYEKYKDMKKARDSLLQEEGGLSYRAGWFWCKEDAMDWGQAVAVCRVLMFVC